MELEQAAEYETDELLVNLVRVQHLTQKIFHVNSRHQKDDELPGVPTTPLAVYHAAFQIELDRLRSLLPSKFGTNCK
jgi:hypothetical protein